MGREEIRPGPNSGLMRFLRLRSSGRRRDSVFFLIRGVLLTMFGAIVLRSIVVAPYFVPSQSMMPSLQARDFIVVWRWPYASLSKSFLAFGAVPDAEDRAAHLPRRGSIVVFSSPSGGGVNYVKRVIALPGDTLAVRKGTVILNGKDLKQVPLPNYDLPLEMTQGCVSVQDVVDQVVTLSDGAMVCRFRRYLETLPNGTSYAVLDIADSVSDDMAEITVPAGRIFVMGDNRDNSLDSRFGLDRDGVGLVPASLVEGEVVALMGASMTSRRRSFGFRDPSSNP